MMVIILNKLSNSLFYLFKNNLAILDYLYICFLFIHLHWIMIMHILLMFYQLFDGNLIISIKFISSLVDMVFLLFCYYFFIF
jgi:hypothetical protein